MSTIKSAGQEAELDDFAPPVPTGMRRVERPVEAPDEALIARLDEFDAVRNRGAVEARTAWLG